MNRRSFLLGLSGSEESVFASELAWSMAERIGATVLAQHIIDTKAIGEILFAGAPGFVDANLYASASQSIVEQMLSLGAQLVERYQARASEHKLVSVCVVDEGNPVEEMCRRAPHHDLVVIGHRPSVFESPEDERRYSFKFSLAESLAHLCPRPLLVVQDHCPVWSQMRICLPMEHVNLSYIKACLDFALDLAVTPTILCLGAGVHDESANHFMLDLRESCPEVSQLPIEVRMIEADVTNDKAALWFSCQTELAADLSPAGLMIIPTREIGHRRITVFGSSPAAFIRHLNLSSILLWPEECLNLPPQEKLTVASAHS